MIPNGTNPFSTKTRVTNMHMYGITKYRNVHISTRNMRIKRAFMVFPTAKLKELHAKSALLICFDK